MSLSSPLSSPPLKRERRKQARPGELLSAALALFVEKGFAATRVEEIAVRAGVSKGTLFLYFPTKVDLFKAVIQENIVQLFPSWEAELAAFQGSSAAMLRYAMQSWWRSMGETPASGVVKLVLSEAQNFPEVAAFYQEKVVTPGTQILQRVLARGVQSGEFRPMDTHKTVLSIIAPMIFLMMWKNSMGACASVHNIDPEQFIENQVDVLLHGLATKGHP